jgi:metal-responsive CopG/Arc/MetJ family transcriptional regulator
MGTTSNISVRLSNDLLDRIAATGVNRNAFIKEAIEEKLNPVKMPELTKTEQKAVIKEVKNISELMRDAMMQRLQSERNLLDNMPKDEFVQMVVRLMPKENLGDTDLEADVLSLQRCIAALPGMTDITEELNRVKGEYAKLLAKYKTAKRLLNHVQHKETFAELMEGVYRALVEYVVEMAARNALPGVGDGGGLSAAGYADLADRVRLDLEKLKIAGRAGKW